MSQSLPIRVHRVVLRSIFVAVAILSMCAPSRSAAQVASDPDTLVYHQITNRDSPYTVGTPEISADGSRIAFSDFAGASDATMPNRIFVIDADGTGLTEVDSYRPLCGCGALLDISADGSVVVSTDGVQVRVAEGGSARELLVQTSGEITALRLTADGEKIFLVFRRDTATVDGTAIERGVWTIDVASGELSPVVVATDLVAFFDLPAPYGCCLPGDGTPLDISADGSQIVFDAYGADGEYVLGVDPDGGNLHEISGPFAYVLDAAISADGTTVAFDGIQPDSNEDQVGVLAFGGGEPRIVATQTGASFADILRLSEDGSQLLLTPSSYLIDTASGDTRQLAVPTPGAGGHDALLADGMARASMNGDATRFAYVMRHVRCADCANLPEQIATLDLGPADLGDAPTIGDAAVDPDEIPNDTSAPATTTAGVDTEHEVIAVGAVFLRDGLFDVNVGFGATMLDDGLLGDTRANDDIFTYATVAYSQTETREDDTGPRTVRVQAEVETADGLRRATAVDASTLTVVAP